MRRRAAMAVSRKIVRVFSSRPFRPAAAMLARPTRNRSARSSGRSCTADCRSFSAACRRPARIRAFAWAAADGCAAGFAAGVWGFVWVRAGEAAATAPAKTASSMAAAPTARGRDAGNGAVVMPLCRSGAVAGMSAGRRGGFQTLPYRAASTSSSPKTNKPCRPGADPAGDPGANADLPSSRPRTPFPSSRPTGGSGGNSARTGDRTNRMAEPGFLHSAVLRTAPVGMTAKRRAAMP